MHPAMAKAHFFLSLIILRFSFSQASSNSDVETLMAFKAASDTSNKLSTWNTSTDPCNWYGVSCLQNRVSRLVLEDLDLHGTFQPLTSLPQLRVLSLKRNRLSGPIPDLSKFTALKLLFLSYNEFSGEFPESVTSLYRLYRLDLSYNNLSSQIPATLNHLIHLLTLRLEENRFSGSISQLDLPNLQDFNVSGNRLSGEIPKSLSSFPQSAFANNPALCGSPLADCKSVSGDPSRPGSAGAVASPLGPSNNLTPVVSSSPSSIPANAAPARSGNPRHSSKISPLAIILIIVGDIFVLAVVSLLLYCYFWRNYAGKMGDGKGSHILEGEKIVYSSSPYPTQPGFERGHMVFFEGAKKFELEDLLRASAEMLGKGGFGTAYKAVLDDGNVVAVKRLKEASISGKREFEQQMEVLGRLRHPNVVSLKAYYFARDEKLLVYDYMPNGNLFWLLHVTEGPSPSIVTSPCMVDKAANSSGNNDNNTIISATPPSVHRPTPEREPVPALLLFFSGSPVINWIFYGYCVTGNRGPGRTPLDWTTRLKIAAGAARGLAFIHNSCRSLRLTHGNIKSTNVLIDKAGNARVSDFGLSVFSTPTPATSLPRSGGYRAPEAMDPRKITQKSDVYSFGVLLLELLTGKCPSIAENVAAGSGYGGVVDLPRWVQSVVREEWTAEVFDLELMRYKDIEEEMVGLLQIAMACTSAAPDQRPKMSHVVKMIEEIRGVEVSPSREGLESVSESPAVSEDTCGMTSQ